MADIKVTSEELHSTSTQLNQASNEIAAMNSNAQGKVQGMQGVWTGSAAAQFQTLFEQWKQGADQAQNALNGISQMLGQAATAYEQTEQQLQQSFAQ